MNHKIKNLKLISGFTVIELSVTIAVTSVIMAIILFSYNGFTDGLALSGAGQDIALTTRETQVYGLTVKEASVGSANFSYAYGIYFDISNSTTNHDYYIFIDKNGDKKYTPGSGCGSGSTECVRKNTLRNNVTITSIDSTGGCPSTNSAKTLDITFLRPNPDADIEFFNNGGGSVCSGATNALITLTSVQGKTQTITVENSGQVSVQ